MKRAMLLTYYVPPRAAIASVRMGHLIVGLREFGWEIVPVTPDFGDVRYAAPVVTTGVIDFKAPVRRFLGVNGAERTSERYGITTGSVHAKPSLKSRAFGAGYELTQYANRQFGWLAHGRRRAAAVLASGRFDAVISSSPPESVHHVAAAVHGALPWIADLRDPWTGGGVGAKHGALGALDRVLEPMTLRSAQALTTVSEPIAAALRERYPKTPVHVVRNAFDQRDWIDIPFVQPSKATFIYAGQLYSGKRDPRPLFAAIADLLHARLVSPDELSVDFYGEESAWLHDEVRRYGIGAVVHIRGMLPRHAVLEKERAASRLLLFLWDDPRERGTYTGKLFEYLGARRPILAIGGPDESVVDDVLASSGAGERVRSVKSIRDAVMNAVAQWRSGRRPDIPPDAVEPFEARHLAERYAQILEGLVEVRR